MILPPVLLPPPLRRAARFTASCLILTLGLPLSSCSIFKAKPAARQSTLSAQKDLQSRPAKGQPFYVERWATTPQTVATAARKPAIRVLPVDLSHLQAMGKTMARMDQGKHGRDALAQRLAAYTQTRFQQESDRYGAPGRRNFLDLHLAITEFTPTSPSGNVVRTAAGFFIGPLTLLGGPLVNGVVAIEGEVRDPKTGRVVFQFADRESDPVTIVSVRSFQPDAFARIIADQWARQFAQVIHTPPGTKVKDAPFLRINPF